MNRIKFACLLVSAISLLGLLSIRVDAKQPAAFARFSGRQIFEGVFFAHGPVAAKIGDVEAPSALQMGAISRLENNIVSRDHKFFATIRTDMTSGDPGLVSRALKRGREEIALASGKMKSGIVASNARFKNDATSRATGTDAMAIGAADSIIYNFFVVTSFPLPTNIVSFRVPSIKGFQGQHVAAYLAARLSQ